MNTNPPEPTPDASSWPPAGREPILAEVIPEFAAPRPPSPWRKRLPLILFLATCLTTFLARAHVVDILLNTFLIIIFEHRWALDVYALGQELPRLCLQGLIYAGSIMTILVCHEMGHYIQARRYRVPATLPFFIPMPIGPIGTLGAVIAMRPGVVIAGPFSISASPAPWQDLCRR